ncbi:hypothetical protein [Micromonospora thermarum]|uniref:Uncharacterized protein n=1 Tax=Micromonospora thermarum TaxID=2720024 RepID=A0ABX0Z775_9ACTN|nr:hypothetical protein [Micromonospora thermarum]NJP33700.1 hypothetical protein [Micromonospora thermarum]
MNRYTAAGVLADMRDGRRVVVLAETPHLARLAFAEVAAHALPGERIRRARGGERITAIGGRGCVAFGVSGSDRFRGLTADVVVFDAHAPSPDALAAAVPMVATGGDVIRP